MPPRRVVSLCPSITESLVAIGGLTRLVGATRYCVRPKGVLWGLPRIGGTKNPDVARILDLKPDLVFANEEENRREDIERLIELGVEVDVSFPKRVADVAGVIRRWGALLSGDSLAEAQALASRVESALDELRAAPAPAPFFYAYWIWREPWMTVSDDTYVADLIGLAGGVNVFGGESARYPVASPNQALARGAAVHFFPSEPYPFRREKHETWAEGIFGRPRVRLFVEGEDYCWHGVRTLEGLRAMRDLRIKLG